ncbi:MAG TPA: glutathione peroxidase [Gammaproteobacteria bacterium]|nr:glutathione peroxidase [Gammaproteobacteria bacterium]
MSLYDIEVRTIEGEATTLERYRGSVLLIVNVASRCGFTPQYKGLESLYRQYRDRGFAVLGFPCDQFAHQEPGDEKEIREFCSLNYDVSFPMFAKIKVNGPGTHPLYRLLKSERRGLFGTQSIKWNFTKFLVGRDGRVLKRFATRTTPEQIAKRVAAVLAR